MFLLFVAIGLALGFAGFFMYHKSKHNSCIERIGEVVQLVGWVIAIIASVLVFAFWVAHMCMATADDKIEMYQEENMKIEQQIADMVEQYQKYETDIFMECKPESSMTMVALYPELKSDALVQSQIEVHTKNNEQIKHYKAILIDRSLINWWLCFGK